jgi:hypothetical protein
MTIQTPEQANRAQRQIEAFAIQAHDVLRAVAALEDAFCGLGDFTEIIGENMPRLAAAAKAIADSAWDWAAISNDNFNPSAPNRSD